MRRGMELALLLLFLVGCSHATVSGSGDVAKMSKEELKAILGRPDVVVIDVRLERGWTESGQKIKGAVREDPQDFNTWVTKYPKEKTYVLY